MKVEIKTNKKGYCECFKIDDRDFGQGIYEVNIKIKVGKMPEIIMKARSDEFILDSEDNKLYLEKYQEENK